MPVAEHVGTVSVDCVAPLVDITILEAHNSVPLGIIFVAAIQSSLAGGGGGTFRHKSKTVPPVAA
jgi:hypothetical protein